MKKRNKRTKLNKRKSHSDMVLRDMLYALLAHGKVETVGARAKVLSRYADKNISHALGWGEKATVTRMQTVAGSKRAAEILKLYCDFLREAGDAKLSGFTSSVRTRYRKGDNSLMAEVRLYNWEDFSQKVDSIKKKKKKSTGRKSKKQTSKIKQSDKEQQKGKKPEVEDDQGLISKLSGRILGRKSQDPNVTKRTRTRARSGL